MDLYSKLAAVVLVYVFELVGLDFSVVELYSLKYLVKIPCLRSWSRITW